MTLSPKHLQVRDFILRYQAERGDPPVYKEIMEATGIRSTRTIHKCIKALKRAGELRLEYVQPKAGAAGV